jgi:hypothetical protein
LTAGVIALGIIAYGVFRIDTENTASVLLVTQDGSRPIMIGGNAISQLIGEKTGNDDFCFLCFQNGCSA